MTGKEQLLAVTAGVHFVEIDGTGVEQGRTYIDKKDGLTKPLRGRQTGFLWQGARYPIEVSVDIPDGKGPYRPGLYVFAGAMFGAGKFGRLEYIGTRNVELIPVADAARALADLEASHSGEVVDLAERKTGTK